jgi:hypothetical protein
MSDDVFQVLWNSSARVDENAIVICRMISHDLGKLIEIKICTIIEPIDLS